MGLPLNTMDKDAGPVKQLTESRLQEQAVGPQVPQGMIHCVSGRDEGMGPGLMLISISNL